MIAVVLMGLLFAAAAGSPGQRPITEAEGIVAVYAQDRGLGSDPTPKLLVVAWSDGHVVWSEDRVHGGPPYLAGRVEPARVATALARAERDGVFRDKKLGQPCLGPDSKFITILLKVGNQRLEMDSWHEIYEQDGRLVASSCALTPVSDGRRLDVLRKEPAEYLYYRVVWGELRALASSLIPKASRPIAGEVVMKAGIVSWREGKAP